MIKDHDKNNWKFFIKIQCFPSSFAFYKYYKITIIIVIIIFILSQNYIYENRKPIQKVCLEKKPFLEISLKVIIKIKDIFRVIRNFSLQITVFFFMLEYFLSVCILI